MKSQCFLNETFDLRKLEMAIAVQQICRAGERSTVDEIHGLPDTGEIRQNPYHP